jgi:hypothetical protein
MLETPSIPHYLVASQLGRDTGDNVTGADNQQERLIERKAIRILRDHTPDVRDIG